MTTHAKIDGQWRHVTLVAIDGRRRLIIVSYQRPVLTPDGLRAVETALAVKPGQVVNRMERRGA